MIYLKRSSPFPKQPNPQGAATMIDTVQIEHKDSLNQPIHPGATVAFTWSNMPGVKIGTVQKLTRRRVRIAYKWIWADSTGDRRIMEWTYLAVPERVLVLADTLGQELTVQKLKGMLP